MLYFPGNDRNMQNGDHSFHFVAVKFSAIRIGSKLSHIGVVVMFPAHARVSVLLVSFCINKYKAYLILLVADLNHRTASTMSSG